MTTQTPRTKSSFVALLVIIAFGIQTATAASINNGNGNLLMTAGQISLWPNGNTNAGVISVNVGSFVISGPDLITYSWGTQAGVTVNGTLTESGVLTIQGATLTGALNPFALTFGTVANDTGIIFVEGISQYPAILTFGSDYDFNGTLQLKLF